MKPTYSYATVGLMALVTLQAVMLLALFSRTAPHPPLAVPPFAIGPFIGASITVAIAALMLGATEARAGIALALLAVVCAMVSFGPQKYFDPQFPLIWPAVLSGQVASLTVCAGVIGAMQRKYGAPGL